MICQCLARACREGALCGGTFYRDMVCFAALAIHDSVLPDVIAFSRSWSSIGEEMYVQESSMPSILK